MLIVVTLACTLYEGLNLLVTDLKRYTLHYITGTSASINIIHVYVTITF